jgi:hypothetical protein
MKTSYGRKLLPYLRPYRLRFFWALDFPFCRHKPDLPPVYDVLSAAVAARRATLFRPQVPPAPEGLRRQPELPPMPITGGKRTDRQQPLPLEEPLLSLPQPSRRRRSRS